MKAAGQRLRLPYGSGWQEVRLPAAWRSESLLPPKHRALKDVAAAIRGALARPKGAAPLRETQAKSAAIAINDNTRPTPHAELLPPLLAELEKSGIAPENIHLFIAGGTHRAMTSAEIAAMLPPAIIARYRIHTHDGDDASQLRYLGKTRRGTPIHTNAAYLAAELRLVVGILAPHQFMGFGGGVKGAAIGLAGKATIHHNHALMLAEGAEMGRFSGNPAREDIEEIGARIGIHFALDITLNNHRQITGVHAGAPAALMRAALPELKAHFATHTAAPFDLMLVSPGGYPKDINLYQAQKGLYHAARVTKDGGALVLCAACRDGSGSQAYEDWLAAQKPTSQQVVLAQFQQQPFRVGPHKAFQIARETTRLRVIFVTEMPSALCQLGLLETAPSLGAAIEALRPQLPESPRVGVMPLANDTIAQIGDGRLCE